MTPYPDLLGDDTMNTSLHISSAVGGALLFTGLLLLSSLAQAAPPASSPKDEAVKKYLEACQRSATKDAACEKLKREAVEILKEDLLTLGSSASRGYFLSILPVFAQDEPELRIAAADALGMIGPQDSDVELLAPLANDPVPDVRRAVWQMISHGKGNAMTLLGQRVQSMRAGLLPDSPPDPVKLALPVAPGSTYLFYASDPAVGRLSYGANNAAGIAGFFKAKAKKGPYTLDQFHETYRYQLQDEQQAFDRAQEAAAKQLESVKPPDPTNAQAFMEYMGKIQSVQASRGARMQFDNYEPRFFASPAVYVLEERQIGQRSYPTRYVVLYHDQALKSPGYRLSWLTVPDEAIKAVQVASLKQQQEEEARKKDEEAQRKRADELQTLQKKKDEQEKKKFKKGQADLEKELGF